MPAPVTERQLASMRELTPGCPLEGLWLYVFRDGIQSHALFLCLINISLEYNAFNISSLIFFVRLETYVEEGEFISQTCPQCQTTYVHICMPADSQIIYIQWRTMPHHRPY